MPSSLNDQWRWRKNDKYQVWTFINIMTEFSKSVHLVEQFVLGLASSQWLRRVKGDLHLENIEVIPFE